jgi:HEAT repeat protein
LDSNKPEKKKRFSEEMIQSCLRILRAGDIEELFEIIPRIGVLRDPSFREPLLSLLNGEDQRKREFAAYAMGAMGTREFLQPLRRAFLDAESMRGRSAESLQIAVIEAIGAIGDDAAADTFMPILRSPSGAGKSRLGKLIVESLGAIAQQGGERSLQGLLELTYSKDAEIRAHALGELSVAYWHRPNDVPDEMLVRICELMQDRSTIVAESALSALQSLADVGCSRAERLFTNRTSE